MPALFDSFPTLEGDALILRKMAEEDVDALAEITDNERVYRFIPPFLHKKSKKELLTAIRNLGGRDFEKKKRIIAGVYLAREPNRLVGLAEMFDYKKRDGQITIGYRVNEAYWGQGIATEIVALLVAYLTRDMGIPTLKAFVMPENVFSAKALVKNGFREEAVLAKGERWGGQDVVALAEYTYRSGDEP